MKSYFNTKVITLESILIRKVYIEESAVDITHSNKFTFSFVQ